MTNDLQPKINTWWAGLTPEDRAVWWSEGDFALYPLLNTDSKTFIVISLIEDSTGTLLLAGDWEGMLRPPAYKCTPAPCASLWVKLEAWLGDDLWRIDAPMKIADSANRARLLDWWYYWLSYLGNIKPRCFGNKDRWHALLDSVLAKQGEGK